MSEVPSFLWLNDIPLFKYIAFCTFMNWWHLHFYTFWLIWTVLLWTFVYKFLCGHMFSFLLDIYFGHICPRNFCIINIPCLSFWGIAKLFSKMGTPFCIPTRNVWSFQFFHMHTETCYFLSFWSNHPRGCEVVAPCGFWFAFLLWLLVLIIFSCVKWPFVDLWSVCLDSLPIF